LKWEFEEKRNERKVTVLRWDLEGFYSSGRWKCDRWRIEERSKNQKQREGRRDGDSEC
jgi:hypothetical protein